MKCSTLAKMKEMKQKQGKFREMFAVQMQFTINVCYKKRRNHKGIASLKNRV